MLIKGGLRWIPGVRLLHCSGALQAVDKATLSKLRKNTGFPFINCKKALEKFDGDFAQAKKWLRDEAQKEGWAKATKLQGRPMSQGLVGVVVEKLSAVLIEVNCETDFVAKNPKFQSLVSRTASMCLHDGQESQKPKVLYDKVALNALSAKEGQSIADLVALEVGQIGENMAVRRALYLQVQPDQHLGTYVHAAGPHVVKDNRCTMGRFGSIVTFTHAPVTNNTLDTAELGRQLGQHIIGMNPQRVGGEEEDECTDEDASKEQDERMDKDASQEKDEPKDVDMSQEQEERKDVDTSKEQERKYVDTSQEQEERKDEKSKEQDKYKEEDTSMLQQEFLLDESLTVREFLQQNGAIVLDFARFECGEDLGDDDKES